MTPRHLDQEAPAGSVSAKGTSVSLMGGSPTRLTRSVRVRTIGIEVRQSF